MTTKLIYFLTILTSKCAFIDSSTLYSQNFNPNNFQSPDESGSISVDSLQEATPQNLGQSRVPPSAERALVVVEVEHGQEVLSIQHLSGGTVDSGETGTFNGTVAKDLVVEGVSGLDMIRWA